MSGVFCVFKKIVSLTCISGLLVTMNLPLFSAYEAHVINVTAKIENDVPSIDPPGGEFCNDGRLEVALSTTLVDPNTSIIYTTDDSDPDCFIPNGIVYTGTPFPLTYSATVKARVCHERDGELLQSVIMSEYYDVLSVYCDVECKPCDGQVSKLTLQYNGVGPANVEVTMTQGGVLFELFNGTVLNGEQFNLVGPVESNPSGTLDTNILLYVDGEKHTEIHTSCSEAIGPGMIFGDFLVIDGESRNGGLLCPGVVLNEFLPNPSGDDSLAKPDGEWVELYNLFDQEFSLSGYYLTDGDGDRIDVEGCRTNTGDTMIEGNGFLVVYRNGGDSCESNGFDLDNLDTQTEDTLSLFDGSNIRFDQYTYTLEGACSLTPTPDGSNIDDSSGVCNTEVPIDKSYARIPDGVGDWVDPVPTPGTPNVLEDPLVAPSVSTSGVVDTNGVDAISIDAGDSNSGDNTSDSIVDSDNGVISDAASEDSDSGAGDEARDENLDDLLGDVVDSEEDPDAIPEDDEGLDTALEDEENLDATVDEEDSTAAEPEEEDPLLVDGAVNNEEDEAGINDETIDTSEENPLPVDDVVNNEEDEAENVNDSGADSADSIDSVSGSTDEDTVDTVDGVGDSDADSDEAEKIGGSINGGVDPEIGGDAVSVDAVDMDTVDNTVDPPIDSDDADDFADSDDSVIEFSL